MPGNRGFTLIEVLVAVAIFAVLSVLAFGALDSVSAQRETLAERQARLREVQTAVSGLDRDLLQAVVRTASAGPPFRLDASGFTLTRGGWRNSLGEQRSELERVGYVLEGSELRRRAWPYPDPALSAPGPGERPVLSGVESLRIRALGSDGRWQESWPPREDAPALPRALEVRLTLAGWGELRRVYELGLTGAGDPVFGSPE